MILVWIRKIEKRIEQHNISKEDTISVIQEFLKRSCSIWNYELIEIFRKGIWMTIKESCIHPFYQASIKQVLNKNWIVLEAYLKSQRYMCNKSESDASKRMRKMCVHIKPWQFIISEMKTTIIYFIKNLSYQYSWQCL